VDPSISDGSGMQELTVTWLGTVTPIYKEKEVTIDAGRGIYVDIELKDTDGNILDSCSGQAEISDEDYEMLKTQVIAADFANYEPPAVGDENCTVNEGTQGVAVAYSYIDAADEGEGETDESEDETEVEAEVQEVSFETGTCAMETAIQNVTVVVDGLADSYVTDCTDETVVGMVDDGDDDADGEGDDTMIDEIEPVAQPKDDFKIDDKNDTPKFRPIPVIE